MTDDKRREAFEAQLMAEHRGGRTLLFRKSDGSYGFSHVQWRWMGWCAALDSVAIKLPPKFDRTGDLHFCFDGYETVAAIESAGVRVKV